MEIKKNRKNYQKKLFKAHKWKKEHFNLIYTSLEIFMQLGTLRSKCIKSIITYYSIGFTESTLGAQN